MNFPLYQSAMFTIHSQPSNNVLEKNCMDTNMGITLSSMDANIDVGFNIHDGGGNVSKGVMTKEEAYSSEALGQLWFTYPGLLFIDYFPIVIAYFG
jgi:hypothetical protein